MQIRLSCGLQKLVKNLGIETKKSKAFYSLLALIMLIYANWVHLYTSKVSETTSMG